MSELPKITIKPFDELSLKDLHACLKLRGEVFVVGQQIYLVPDVDEYDPGAYHVMMRLSGVLVGTARLLPMAGGKTIKVGRVAVAQAYRGRGLGRSMMRAIQAWIRQHPGRTGVMAAQANLERWYGHLGWLRDGDLFIEAGIEHIEMFLPRGDVDEGG